MECSHNKNYRFENLYKLVKFYLFFVSMLKANFLNKIKRIISYQNFLQDKY